MLCIQTQDTHGQPQPVPVLEPRVLSEEPDEMYQLMAGRFGEDMLQRTVEIAERCYGRGRAGRDAPAAGSTCPRARTPCRTCATWPSRACASATDRRRQSCGDRARVRAADDRGDGLPRLLPDRLGLHPLRPRERHQRRPRPRLGGGLARRLLPAHHRPRPDALHAAVRALPEPRAQEHAGHRHRLRRGRPRARDQLRRREVRPPATSPRSSPSARCSRRRRSRTPAA